MSTRSPWSRARAGRDRAERRAQLQFNQSSGTDGGYIDFTADPTALTNPLDTDADNAGLRISTGVSVEQFVDLNFNTEFLRVAGDMTATVDGFVYASGSLALEKKGAGTVSVKPSVGACAATPQAVDLLTLGGTVDLFAGVNAPQDIATLDPADPGDNQGAAGPGCSVRPGPAQRQRGRSDLYGRPQRYVQHGDVRPAAAGESECRLGHPGAEHITGHQAGHAAGGGH